MQFYRGVIEDNNSPLKDGRVKVRVHGLHGSSGGDFESTGTDSLPWAEVMGGTGFGLVSGVGLSGVLRQGTWVWVFLDGDDPNKPIVVGTISGIVSGTDAAGGFADPSGVYPIPERKNFESPDEVPISRIGRSDTHPMADDGYPNTTVLETHGGHVVVMSDTEIKIIHNSGTRVFILPDGTVDIKSVHDVKWDIAGDFTLRTGGDYTIENGGNYKVTAQKIDLN